VERRAEPAVERTEVRTSTTFRSAISATASYTQLRAHGETCTTGTATQREHARSVAQRPGLLPHHASIDRMEHLAEEGPFEHVTLCTEQHDGRPQTERRDDLQQVGDPSPFPVGATPRR
jgi:hypothetical protein